MMEFGGSSMSNNGGSIMGWVDSWELNNNTIPIPIPIPIATSSGSALRAPRSLYGRGGSHEPPDPHLVCLKLLKPDDYFEDYEQTMARKKGKAVADVPRCQVDRCHVALLNAKDYNRRLKVCEAHSKAAKVNLLGLEQRFCQQCSRSVSITLKSPCTFFGCIIFLCFCFLVGLNESFLILSFFLVNIFVMGMHRVCLFILNT